MKPIKNKILVTAIAIGLTFSFSTMAQTQLGTNYSNAPPPSAGSSLPCTPEAMAAITAETNSQLDQAHRALDSLNKVLTKDFSDANGASAVSLMQQCVGSWWPGGGFRMPTLQDLINAAKAYIAQQCGNLRSKISESLPDMQSLSIDTGIPGMGSVGYSGGISQGGSSPVWTVNGQDPKTGIGGVTQTNTPFTPGGIAGGISGSLPSAPPPRQAPPPSNNPPPPPSNQSGPIDKLKCLLGGC